MTRERQWLRGNKGARADKRQGMQGICDREAGGGGSSSQEAEGQGEEEPSRTDKR